MKYNYIYTHHNGAKIYENEKGRKKIYYDDIEFSSIGSVNRYIADKGVEKHNFETNKREINAKDYVNYKEDYLKHLFK